MALVQRHDGDRTAIAVRGRPRRWALGARRGRVKRHAEQPRIVPPRLGKYAPGAQARPARASKSRCRTSSRPAAPHTPVRWPDAPPAAHRSGCPRLLPLVRREVPKGDSRRSRVGRLARPGRPHGAQPKRDRV
eukprot:scaffold11770_cov106-Isochrysis_galbana.AAC.3